MRKGSELYNSPTEYACPKARVTTAEGMEHYERSLFTHYRPGDPDVLALLDENAALRERMEKAEVRIAELEAMRCTEERHAEIHASGHEEGHSLAEDRIEAAEHALSEAINQRQAAESSLAALQARVAELEGALKPLSGHLTVFPADLDEGDDEEVEIVLTRRDLKRIERALPQENSHGG